MGWVKLDDGFYQHPKVVRVGRDAKALYLAGLCYAGAQLTDGFIPTEALKILAAGAEIVGAPKAARQLVDAGLWDQTKGGFMVHDYLDYNQSADRVRANRDAARDRMSRARSREQSRTDDDRSPNVRANNGRSSREVREQDTDRDTDTPPDGGGERAAQAPPPTPEVGKRERSRGSRIPDSFAVTDAMRTWAHGQGLADAMIDRETAKFRDYYLAESGQKGTKLDWFATWRLWMSRAQEKGGSPDNLRSIADRRRGSDRQIITPDMTEADILGSYPAERTRS